MIPRQKDLILKENWKYLIVLDSCRYDTFKKIYKYYFKGSLLQVKSAGTATKEWIENTLKDGHFLDTIYISANPFINSLNFSSLTSTKWFYKVIDVWKWGWSDKLMSVHPREVNKAVFKAINLYPKKRFIIHYIQPHQPFITPSYILKVNKNFRRVQDKVTIKKIIPQTLRKLLGNYIIKILGKSFYTRIVASIEPKTNYHKFIEEYYGNEKLRLIYELNLKYVCHWVKKLISKLKGKKIITSDHGELLGEMGLYGHINTLHIPKVQIYVPWLIIKK